MSNLFSPTRPDGRSLWRAAYEDLFVGRGIGEVVTYAEISDLLGRPKRDVYQVASRVGKELRSHDKRSIEAVAGVGYRILHPSEHELQARRYQKQSRRRMSTSLAVVKATDVSLLSQEERHRSMALGMVLQGMCQAIDMLDHRQRRTQAALTEHIQASETRLNAQEAQMERMARAMREAGILK